jgi:hypothetical protein
METAICKYVELATVAVKNPYYVNGICKTYHVSPVLDFEVVPTNECVAVMKRLDIIFRRDDHGGGFILLGRVSGAIAGDDLLRFPPQTADTLTFWLKLGNPDLLNFDDLPTKSNSNTFFYFTNQQTDVLALRNNLHLTSASSGVSGTSDSMMRSPSTYRFHHTAEVVAGTAKVTHILSGMEVLPASLVNQTGQSDILFNLSNLPLGTCQLSIGGSVVDEFYHIGNPGFSPFGVIELLLSDALLPNYRIVESDRTLTKTRPAYSILLNNRKTFWRYIIHLQSNSPLFLEMEALLPAEKADFLNKLNIITNDTAITFTRKSATDAEIVFVSDNEQPLQEKYTSATTHDHLSLTLTKYIGVMAKEAVVKSDLSYHRVAGPVSRYLLPHNVACRFPALRSSEDGSQNCKSLQLCI